MRQLRLHRSAATENRQPVIDIPNQGMPGFAGDGHSDGRTGKLMRPQGRGHIRLMYAVSADRQEPGRLFQGRVELVVAHRITPRFDDVRFDANAPKGTAAGRQESRHR